MLKSDDVEIQKVALTMVNTYPKPLIEYKGELAEYSLFYPWQIISNMTFSDYIKYFVKDKLHCQNNIMQVFNPQMFETWQDYHDILTTIYNKYGRVDN